jgi:transposase
MGNVYPSAEAWSKVFEYLNNNRGIYIKNTKKTRRFLKGIYWLMRTGAQWRELPNKYGKYRSVHKRFNEWAAKGVWQALLECVALDVDGEWVSVDSTAIRAHPCASGYEKGQNEREGLGRSKGGFTSKIHVLVDALGNPLKFTLTGGNRNDITQGPELVKDIKNAFVLADKGYDSDAFVEQITSQDCIAIIPPRARRKAPRQYDEELYKERNLVERFFRKLKNFRRIFSRFDKQARNYLAFIAFASTFLWLK